MPDVPTPGDAAARVFFALVPPAPLRAALGQLAQDVARRARGRPVPTENIHATLAFIGTWPVDRLDDLYGVGATVHGEPTRIILDTQGGFRRAGVAWIGPSRPPAALIRLANDLVAALSAAGIGTDQRSFHPHVTLARHCRGPFPRGNVGPLSWDATSMDLMASQTRSEGAHYATLASWPLPS